MVPLFAGSAGRWKTKRPPAGRDIRNRMPACGRPCLCGASAIGREKKSGATARLR